MFGRDINIQIFKKGPHICYIQNMLGGGLWGLIWIINYFSFSDMEDFSLSHGGTEHT